MAEITLRKWNVGLGKRFYELEDEVCYGYLDEPFGRYVERGPVIEGEVYTVVINTHDILRDMEEEFGRDFVEGFCRSLEARKPRFILHEDLVIEEIPSPELFFTNSILSYIKGTWSDWKERVLLEEDYGGGCLPPFHELTLYFKHESDRRRFLEGVRDYVYRRIRERRY